MKFDQDHGWNETTITSLITTQRQVVAAQTDARIIVRRVRGTCAGATFVLKSGNTVLTPEFAAGNFDVPGLYYMTERGQALNIEDATGTMTENNITIQWAYRREAVADGVTD